MVLDELRPPAEGSRRAARADGAPRHPPDRPLPQAAVRTAHRVVPADEGRPRRASACGRRLRSHDAVQPALRVLLRRRSAQHRGRVARGAAARDAEARVSRSGRPAGQPDRRRDLHAEGHPRRDGGLSREGLRLRVPHDQRDDHQRGAGRGAGRAGERRVSSAHQRVDRRPGRAARQGARRGRHVRADGGRAAPAPGRRPRTARAAARQHQHDRRARDARRARSDGGRRRGARAWTRLA